MEMQFFIYPKDEKKWYNYWINNRLNWHFTMNLGKKNYRISDHHNNLAHYASKGSDIEFKFPFGFKEIEGIHSRRNFDLKKHKIFSNKKYLNKKLIKEKYFIPYVIETSLGLDRLFLSILYSSLKEEKINNGNKRTVLKIPPYLSPIKAAIFPLVMKDNLPEIAKKIFKDLKINYKLIYDQKSSIGKLYRRQDAIGTPLCFTIDHKTVKTNTVTVRYRDNMIQKRVYIKEISDIIENETGMKNLLKRYSSFIG